MVAGELERRRMEHEPAALRQTERSYPIGAGQLRDPARGLEEPHDPLEGVLAIDRGREPPQLIRPGFNGCSSVWICQAALAWPS